LRRGALSGAGRRGRAQSPGKRQPVASLPVDVKAGEIMARMAWVQLAQLVHDLFRVAPHRQNAIEKRPPRRLVPLPLEDTVIHGRTSCAPGVTSAGGRYLPTEKPDDATAFSRSACFTLVSS